MAFSETVISQQNLNSALKICTPLQALNFFGPRVGGFAASWFGEKHLPQFWFDFNVRSVTLSLKLARNSIVVFVTASNVAEPIDNNNPLLRHPHSVLRVGVVSDATFLLHTPNGAAGPQGLPLPPISQDFKRVKQNMNLGHFLAFVPPVLVCLPLGLPHTM